MRSVAFHPEARSELRESIRYYRSQEPDLGRRFLAAVRETVELIRMLPLMFRIVEADFHQCRVFRFPFGLIYRVRNDQVQIVAVMHLHREPGHWKSRIG